MAILVELDPQSWGMQLDRFAAWLGNVQTAQSSFREVVEETAPRVQEPHIRMALEQMAERAKEHETQVAELFRLIGREPAKGLRQVAGEVMAEIGQAMGALQGRMGGAHGAWSGLQNLAMANLNAMSAFAIAETLGLALAMPEIVAITFPIVHAKQTDQLLIQEYMLEMAAVSILYQAET